MLQAKLLCRKLGMHFCSQLNINKGMYTDVLALLKKCVNTQYEPQSSEGFAQLSSAGMEAECRDSAADEPSASSADPWNTGIRGESHGNQQQPSVQRHWNKWKDGKSNIAEYQLQDAQQPDLFIGNKWKNPSRITARHFRQRPDSGGVVAPLASVACLTHFTAENRNKRITTH